MTETRSTLIFGGARSGKSEFAERLCENSDLDLLYVATSAPQEGDEEMAQRIKLHQDRRGGRWKVIEEPIYLGACLRQYARENQVILIDCVTLWLSNLMFQNQCIKDHSGELLQSIRECPGKFIFISNEVGQGTVPDHALSRKFRDEQGLINQKLAKRCDRVIEVRAGLPLQLKPSPYPAITL
ncbi:MAG: bifunctional adenosylcobinamide kinase/adenosylcobinamide-phosphate guanylyltransferase [Cohaesibacter sp.]|nr:bifunctional adenosylcobinamide kinase/adenosylcobinamide-phosphate guanylyltransferase [Cohaesibacter sp.]